MKKWILILALIAPGFAFAEDSHKGHQGDGHAHGHGAEKHSHPATLEKVSADGVQVIKVKGMVCELCAQGVKKKLKAQNEVKDVEVKIKEHKVTITYKDPKKILSGKKLSELLLDAGYELDTKN